MENKINVTKAFLPSLEEYIAEISPLWESHWLTNMGDKHQELQKKLTQYLDVTNIDLLEIEIVYVHSFIVICVSYV